MKILQVIPYFSRKKGGEVNVCYNISKQLTYRGHKVTIATSTLDYDKPYAASLEGVEFLPFRSLLNVGLLTYTPDFRRYLRDNCDKFDVIHLHAYWTYQNVVVHGFAAKEKVPYVIQAHGSLTMNRNKGLLKSAFDRQWGRILLKDASRAIAITGTEADQYANRGVLAGNIELVPNGIDLSDYSSLPERGLIRAKYGLGMEDKLVLYVGRLHETKGIDMLIRAFAIVTTENERAKLLIVGPDDGAYGRLINLVQALGIREKVGFAGFIDKADKICACVDADVFVTPTYLGFPVTFLEALACGLPIITTENGDRLDWINNRVGVVTHYAAADLAKEILEILEDNELRKRYATNGRSLIAKEFNWERITEELEKIYQAAGRKGLS